MKRPLAVLAASLISFNALAVELTFYYPIAVDHGSAATIDRGSGLAIRGGVCPHARLERDRRNRPSPGLVQLRR